MRNTFKKKKNLFSVFRHIVAKQIFHNVITRGTKSKSIQVNFFIFNLKY